MEPANALPNYLQNAYDVTSKVRDQGGLSGWNDAWSNFMVNYALSEYEFGNNKAMWQLMNEYNSPQAQMQRFKEAGLNPMLVYQQGNPGNASSPVQYNKPNIEFTPDKARNADLNAKLQAANSVIGVVTNLVDNIGGLINQGYDLHLKKNQVLESDFNREVMAHSFPYEPFRMPAVNYAFIEDYLNPLSSKFDPLAYVAFSKQGMLPQFINQYLSADVTRQLQGFRANYQKYYNENLLPKFNAFQQGKVDIQEIEKAIQGYNKETLEMIPAPIRGLVEPLVQWLSPFLKFIFKSTKFTTQ